MSKYLFGFLIACLVVSCNNESKDSVQKADSANQSRRDSNATTNAKAAIATDKASSDFLVAALDGGMMEVDLGYIAEKKAQNERVKNFGKMMVTDHESANAKIKDLASIRTVAFPTSNSTEKSKTIGKLNATNAKDFDKAYIDLMVTDHKEDIKEFESAAKRVSDTEIVSFINSALPDLRKHLDSCIAIQQALKNK